MTAVLRRWILRPLNRQLGQHVEHLMLSRFDARLDDLSGQIEEVRLATVEVRRIVTDDLDASNETAALIGRALATLGAAVEELRGEVAELRSGMVELQARVDQPTGR